MANERYDGPYKDLYRSDTFYTVAGSDSGNITPVPGPIQTVGAVLQENVNGNTTWTLAYTDEYVRWTGSYALFTGEAPPLITSCITTDGWQSGTDENCAPTGKYLEGLKYVNVKIDTPIQLASGTRLSLQHYGGPLWNVYKIVDFEKSPTYTVTTDKTLYYYDRVLADASSNQLVLQVPWTGYPMSGIECFTVKKIDSSANAVVVSGSGGYSIDGQSTYTINNQYESATFCHAESGNWYVF